MAAVKVIKVEIEKPKVHLHPLEKANSSAEQVRSWCIFHSEELFRPFLPTRLCLVRQRRSVRAASGARCSGNEWFTFKDTR